jgi:CelD/BcsL family acetyltransferase involved in cellulose biosynthesis
MHIERLAGIEAFEDLAPEWEALDAQVHPRTPFSSYLWNVLWWKHFQRNRLSARDEFYVHVVRSSAGELIAIAPMMLTLRPGSGPLQLRILQFFGSDSSITELRGIICRTEHQSAIIQLLVKYFDERATEWDVLRWYGIHQINSPFAEDSSRLKVKPAEPNYLLHLLPTWDQLRSTLSRNMRHNVRKSYDILKRDGHTFEFCVFERPDDVLTALNRFFPLHSARAQLVDTVRHPDRFVDTRNRNFIVDYAQRAAERGSFRIFEIRIKDIAVASRLAFVLGDQLYVYYSGGDPAWAKYSITTTLMAEIIKWAIQHNFKLVNLSVGKDMSKVRWKPEELLFQNAVQVAPTLRGRAAFRVEDTLMRLLYTQSDASDPSTGGPSPAGNVANRQQPPSETACDKTAQC